MRGPLTLCSRVAGTTISGTLRAGGVSSFMRQLLRGNTVWSFPRPACLIHAVVGRAGGVGALRTKRSR